MLIATLRRLSILLRPGFFTIKKEAEGSLWTLSLSQEPLKLAQETLHSYSTT